jgi:hypothetical protein
MVDILANWCQVQFLTKCNVEQGVLKVYHYIRVRIGSGDAGSVPSLSCSVYPITHKISLNFNIRLVLCNSPHRLVKDILIFHRLSSIWSKSGGGGGEILPCLY